MPMPPRYTDEMNRTLERERLQASSATGRADARDEQDPDAEWSTAENQLLVKAMTIFPVGTKSRQPLLHTRFLANTAISGALFPGGTS